MDRARGGFRMDRLRHQRSRGRLRVAAKVENGCARAGRARPAPVAVDLLSPRVAARRVGPAPGPDHRGASQTATVTRRNVAATDVLPFVALWLWLWNSASSSRDSSASFPFFSAASNAFIVGP